MGLSRHGLPGMVGVVAALVALAADPAFAGRYRPPGQCDEYAESNQMRNALQAAVVCNKRRLRDGAGAACEAAPIPACARSVVTDAIALAYGAPIVDAGPVDLDTHQAQYDCQQALGGAAWEYTWQRLHQRLLGASPEEADAIARPAVDAIAPACQGVQVVQDASGPVLPAVGLQCAAAVGPPGSVVDGDALRDCTRTLLERWAEGIAPEPELPRPNILFVMTDDQRYDMVHGEHAPPGQVVMPTVAQLAAEGVEFTSASVTTPLCSPSRASVLSGQYATHTGVYGTNSIEYGATQFDDTSTIATWLDAAGYRTAHIGKYMNGYGQLWTGGVPYIPPGWDEWTTFENANYYGYTLVEDGQVVSYGSSAAEYSTDVLRDRALAFIDEAVASGEPFYLHWVPVAPHAPFVPAPRHVNLFAGIAPYRPPSFNEADVSDKPWYVSGRPPRDEARMDTIRLGQLRSLRAVDEAVAAFVQRLRDHGILDETVIVFTSDHGYLLGEHRLEAKYKPYEEANRVPLIVRYPGLAPLARTDDRPVLNIDFASTFAELAGTSPDNVQDGSSLVRLLDGTAPSWRRFYFTEGWPAGKEYLSVREGKWSYTEYGRNTDPPRVADPELYDLALDPYQLENLAEVPAYADQAEALSTRLRSFRPLWPGDMLNP